MVSTLHARPASFDTKSFEHGTISFTLDAVLILINVADVLAALAAVETPLLCSIFEIPSTLFPKLSPMQRVPVI